MSDLGNKEIFSKNLQYYMEINNKTRYDICNDLNFPYTTFTEWYKGNIYPRIDKIEMLANYFGIKKSDLIEERKKENTKIEEPNQYVLDLYNSLTPENQMNTVSYMRALKLVNKPNKPRVQILGQTAAGKPIEYGDSYAQDIDDISNIPDNADYALIVNGDSMEPDIKNGQLIYVKECPDVENGAIAIVEVDGAVTCKKVYKWNDHIELQSLNTAYEPIIITAGNFRILGKVIKKHIKN